MKVLTITVPCYNSENYMGKCIESLLPGGEDVEILIVDDGSTDKTPELADRYAKEYPSIVRVIHQENGGHGAAVNTGIAQATGVYFKVVDSDDWVKEDSYQKILSSLRELTGGSRVIDMVISNFVYEKEGARHKRVVSFRHVLPNEEAFTWDEVGHFNMAQYFLMHSVIYRTKLLKECGLKLPEHTFYVDNLFVFNPLPYVKNMYYIDTNFYRYTIGREDQSVHESVMIRRIDQQLAVNKLMIDYLTSARVENKKTYRYMVKYLGIITMVSSIMLIRAKNDEALAKKKELWAYLKKKDKRLYYRLRHGFMGSTMNLPGKSGRRISTGLYKIARKFVQFN